MFRPSDAVAPREILPFFSEFLDLSRRLKEASSFDERIYLVDIQLGRIFGVVAALAANAAFKRALEIRAATGEAFTEDVLSAQYALLRKEFGAPGEAKRPNSPQAKEIGRFVALSTPCLYFPGAQAATTAVAFVCSLDAWIRGKDSRAGLTAAAAELKKLVSPVPASGIHPAWALAVNPETWDRICAFVQGQLKLLVPPGKSRK